MMRLELRATESTLAQAMRSYIERRLLLYLGPYVDRLARVTIQVRESVVPDRGTDHSCRIMAELVPSGTIRQETVHPCVFAAMDGAVERISRSVRRQLRRRNGEKAVRPLLWES